MTYGQTVAHANIDAAATNFEIEIARSVRDHTARAEALAAVALASRIARDSMDGVTTLPGRAP